MERSIVAALHETNLWFGKLMGSIGGPLLWIVSVLLGGLGALLFGLVDGLFEKCIFLLGEQLKDMVNMMLAWGTLGQVWLGKVSDGWCGVR
jgi:hypothetical protein